MVIPLLPLLAMVVYHPPVDSLVAASDPPPAFPVKGAHKTGKSPYPMSSMSNFTLFSILSNAEIVRLIEDYGVVFHTTDHKKK
jgi:hypothetical protein